MEVRAWGGGISVHDCVHVKQRDKRHAGTGRVDVSGTGGPTFAVSYRLHLAAWPAQTLCIQRQTAINGGQVAYATPGSTHVTISKRAPDSPVQNAKQKKTVNIFTASS